MRNYERRKPKSKGLMSRRTYDVKKLKATRKQISNCTHERSVVVSMPRTFTEGMSCRVQHSHIKMESTIITSVSMSKSMTM